MNGSTKEFQTLRYWIKTIDCVCHPLVKMLHFYFPGSPVPWFPGYPVPRFPCSPVPLFPSSAPYFKNSQLRCYDVLPSYDVWNLRCYEITISWTYGFEVTIRWYDFTILRCFREFRSYDITKFYEVLRCYEVTNLQCYTMLRSYTMFRSNGTVFNKHKLREVSTMLRRSKLRC